MRAAGDLLRPGNLAGIVRLQKRVLYDCAPLRGGAQFGILGLLAAVAAPARCRFEQADGGRSDGQDVTGQVHEEKYGCHDGLPSV